MGCTEVAAIGLATSTAYNALFGNYPVHLGLGINKCVPLPDTEKVEKMMIKVDRNVFKNACGVAIPKTNGQRGIKLAAALGLFTNLNKNATLKKQQYLNIFDQINAPILERANSLVGKIEIGEADIGEKITAIDISAELIYLKDETETIAKTRICGAHDNIVLIQINDRKIYEQSIDQKAEKEEETLPENIAAIIKIIEAIDAKEKEELRKTIIINKQLTKEGRGKQYGIGIVKALEGLIQNGMLSNDLITNIKLEVASGVEARMGGAPKPAMSTSGSGNMGITATIPIIVTAEWLNIDEDRLLKSILLSHIVTRIISNYTGDLSALCGCFNKSAIGAAAGLTYLLGGKEREINNAINAVAANMTGVICDGAKYSCTLKAMTAAGIAMESALMSVNGIKIPPDGIVAEKPKDTMKNIGMISHSMVQADTTIVKILQNLELTSENN